MKSVLREQRRSSVVAALTTLILGLVLVFWPDRSMDFLCTLLGAALLITGLVYMLGWFARRQENRYPVWCMIPGVILAALGLWLLSSPDAIVALIQYLFAALLVFHGVIDIQAAIALMTSRVKGWWVELLLALVTLGLGALIFINPFGTFSALVILIGLSLMYDGISDLYIIVRLSKAFHKAVEVAEVMDEEKVTADE